MHDVQQLWLLDLEAMVFLQLLPYLLDTTEIVAFLEVPTDGYYQGFPQLFSIIALLQHVAWLIRAVTCMRH